MSQAKVKGKKQLKCEKTYVSLPYFELSAVECHQNVAEVDHSDEPKSLFPGFGQISTKNASGIKFYES